MTYPTAPGAWHAPPEQLEAYAATTLDAARSASVEQHLLACAGCRTSLCAIAAEGPAMTAQLDELWADVIDAVDRPRKGVGGSLLGRLGVPDRIARVIAATPAMRFSWFAAIVLVLGFAVAAAVRPNGTDSIFLIVAPLLPLTGIATAYGTGFDAAFEVTRAAPLPGSRIFLYRSVAVLLTALPLALLAALVLRLDHFDAIGWLLPALGLVGTTMALATWLQPLAAAASSAAAWLALVLGLWLRTVRIDGSTLDATFVFAPSGQILFAVMAAGGAALFALRADRLDLPDDWQMEATR